MSEVKQVTVQLRLASGSDPGQVTYGYYILDGNTLTMTHPDGAPVDDALYRHALQAGDNADAIARVLTKKVRTAMLGEQVPGFCNSLTYPNMGVA